MEKDIYINNKLTNYVITSDGKVFNKKTNKELLGTIKRNEYKSVQLTIDNKPKSFMIHRLVAEAFLDNPNNLPIVDHIDRNKLNNNVENLRWVDNKVNSLNAKKEKRVLKQSFNKEDLEFYEWKVIDNNNSHYLINKEGQIINLKTGKYVMGSERNGYKRVSIGKKMYSIHRLVYETFIDKIPDNMVIDHIDGDRSNNKLENLKLSTQSENMKNSQINGHKGQKSVLKYSLKGEFLEEYPSLSAAARANNISYVAIREAIKREGSSKGYKWKFKDK